MKIAMIGLGRMGSNMARRLMAGGHQCVVFDLNAAEVKKIAGDGAIGATSLEDVVKKLEKPRTAWVMLPAGDPTEKTVTHLHDLMEAGDVIIDGGNSYFKDDVRRAKAFALKGVVYMDVGTSGGVWGMTRGYCLMIGGERAAVERLTPIFSTL